MSNLRECGRRETSAWHDEATEEGCKPNIPLCVAIIIEEETLTLADAMECLKRALGEAFAPEGHLRQLLNRVGLP